MQIPVLVEPVDNNGFRATCGEPLTLSADGATADDALRTLAEKLAKRLQGGAVVRSLQLPVTDHPWKALAGIYPDDALLDEWREILAERRRLDNAGLDAP